MVNIKDVSQRAGVSKATVSNVFNNKPYVSNEIREKVLLAAKELNYYPNKLASSLAAKKTNMIGLFLGPVEAFRHIHMGVIEGVSLKLNQFGYKTILFFDQFSSELNGGVLLQKEAIDGAIMLDPEVDDQRIEEFQSGNTPVVLIGRASQPTKMVTSVDVDNVEISYRVTKELILKGHKHIGLINSKSNLTISSDRLKGYIKALNEFELEFEPFYYFNCDNTKKLGKELGEKILNNQKITAIITESDIVASGVYEALNSKGKKIPDDLSVFSLGGDDTSLRPRVSTAVIDYKKMGELAAGQLIQMLTNQQTEFCKHSHYEMIFSQSVCDLKEG